jgi:hypothetical protein
MPMFATAPLRSGQPRGAAGILLSPRRLAAPLRPRPARANPESGRRPGAPETDARPLAAGLQGLLWAGAPPPGPALAAEAARAFRAGNGFLTGQLVDRSA